MEFDGALWQMPPMERFLWVCLGGALGSGTRYLVASWAQEKYGLDFPWGTLAVNVVGCFFIGLVMQLVLTVADFPPNLRFGLVAGFLGGLTTYSAFAWETAKLASDGARGVALVNFALTTVAGFAAVGLGLSLAKLLVKPAA